MTAAHSLAIRNNSELVPDALRGVCDDHHSGFETSESSAFQPPITAASSIKTAQLGDYSLAGDLVHPGDELRPDQFFWICL
jgi:hypothetical protein